MKLDVICVLWESSGIINRKRDEIKNGEMSMLHIYQQLMCLPQCPHIWLHIR